MDLNQIITITSPTVAIIIGLYSYKYLESSLKIIFIYVCFAALSEIIFKIQKELGAENTNPYGHFYVIIEFFIWSMFYWHHLKNYIKKHFYWLCVMLFELYCFLNIILIQGLYVYPFTRSMEGLLIIILSLVKFYNIMVEGKMEKLIKEPILWINTAVLLYFAGGFFFNILFTELLEQNAKFLQFIISYYFLILNLILYVALTTAFLLEKKKNNNSKKKGLG